MPHGTQWSYDELRNAEKEAKIYADALVEAQRREAERQRKYQESLERRNQTYASPPQPQPQVEVRTRTEYKFIDQPSPSLLKMQIEVLRKAPFGSPEYLRARYGTKIFDSKVQALVDVMGISKEEAENYLSLTYKPVNWINVENRWIREAMLQEHIR